MKIETTIKIKRTYCTSDLCLATILKMNNFKIVQIEKPLQGNRFTFHFEHNIEVEKIAKEYFSSTIENHPHKKFFNELKEIKNLIYNYPIDTAS